MRSLSHKIPCRTLPEVFERFNQVLTRYQVSGKYKIPPNRVISAEALANLIVLKFLDMDRESQDRLIAEYFPRYVAMLSADGPEGYSRGETVHPPPAGDVPAERDITAEVKVRQLGGSGGKPKRRSG